MKNIKSSVLAIIFICCSALPAFSMHADINVYNIERVRTINIHQAPEENQQTNIVQNCNSMMELSDKYKITRSLGNGASSEELIKFLLGRPHRGAWERLGELLYVEAYNPSASHSNRIKEIAVGYQSARDTGNDASDEALIKHILQPNRTWDTLGRLLLVH